MKKQKASRPKGRRVAKLAPKKKTSTALAIRKKAVAKKAPVEKPEPAALMAADTRGVITSSGINPGALGLSTTWKPSDYELKVMGERVDPKLVKYKPGKHGGSPYLPHIHYTRWFNRAFGIGGWAMVPISMPGLTNSTVTCHYVLHVHGQPVAYALGEQEYFEGNKQQSYGDAFESTMASALRRCAKRLGISDELWDRDVWPLSAAHRTGDDGEQPRNRRRQQPQQQRARVPRDEPAGRNPEDDLPITDGRATDGSGRLGQRQRLWTIFTNSGRSEAEMMNWLKRRFNVDRLKEIRRGDYDYICKAIESPGDLPLNDDEDRVFEGDLVLGDDR